MMRRPFSPPKAGLDLSAGLQVMVLAASLSIQSNLFMAQLKLAATAEDDSAAFTAIEAARATLEEIRAGMPKLRAAARPVMASDADLARELAPLLQEDGELDAFAAALADAEEQVRRARLGRTVIGSA